PCSVLCRAEDGIRYWSVTGVQTCALPICTTVSFFSPSSFHTEISRTSSGRRRCGRDRSRGRRRELRDRGRLRVSRRSDQGGEVRSEERRVGEEDEEREASNADNNRHR